MPELGVDHVNISPGRRLLPCHQLSRRGRAGPKGRIGKLSALPYDFRDLIKATLKEMPRASATRKPGGMDQAVLDLQRSRSTRSMDRNVKSWKDISGESSKGWELPEDVLKELDVLFEGADKNANGRLERAELKDHADKIDFFFVNHGVPQSILEDDMEKTELVARFQRAKEVVQKMQALSEIDITKVIACHLKGGEPEEPLRGLIEMSHSDLDTWCQQVLSPKIVDLLWTEKQKLEKRRKNSKGGQRPEPNGKYAVASGTQKATFGPIEDYYRGIIEKLGFPNTNVKQAMHDEHCKRDDSHDFFTPGNYKDFKTNPHNEWKAVTDRDEAVKLTQEGKNHREIKFYKDLVGEDIAFDAKLCEEEVLALQLYSGPMFEKYNSVLRDFPKDKVKALKGNKYVTTIFLIVSGIIKLSQNMVLPADRQVWRGLKNLQLPEEFLRKDEKGIRGGLELSMMSTSTEKSVAVQYAGVGNPTLFRIEIGAIDRGADISFLSQYPLEKEIVFPPSSFIEVVGNVETDMLEDGTVVRVIPLKINANQMTKTIDQFLQQRRQLHTSMLQNFQMEIKVQLATQMESDQVKKRLDKDAFCAWNKHHVMLKDSILQECGEIVDKYKGVEAQDYNKDEFYSMAMKSALDMRTMATLKFSHWLDNLSVQARLIKDQPLMRVERMVLADIHSQFMVAKSNGEKPQRQELARKICILRGCCVKDILERNDMGETPMLVEAANGSVTNLNYILAAGGNVNAKADDGLTPLMAAAFGGYAQCCELLVDNGAYIKETDHEGHTCLYLACENGNLEVVKYIVEKVKDGHDLLMMTRLDGLSCLVIAAKNGHEQVVEYLAKKGGQELIQKTRHRDNVGPMLMASLNGHLEVVKKLFKNGGRDLISTPDASGITPLYIASSNGHKNVVSYLLDKMDDSDKLEKLLFMKHAVEQKTCLHIAAYNNHLDVCKPLLESGGERLMEETDKSGATCFLLACEQGHMECAEFFLEHGGDKKLISQRLNDGRNVLHLACQSGNLALIQHLLSFDDKLQLNLLSERDKNGASCFHYACKHGNLECAKKVRETAKDLKLTPLPGGPSQGETCLHAACESGKLDLVDWLLDPKGLKESVAPMLESLDAAEEYCFHKACRKGHLDLCEKLLRIEHVRERYIKAVNRKQETCLHVATQSGKATLLQVILDEVEAVCGVAEADAMVDARDEEGMTCFALACAKGHVDCVIVLLKRKEDTSEQEDLLKQCYADGQTPLHLASASGSAKLVQYLLEQAGGSDLLTSKNNKGQTCLDVSFASSNFDVFKCLVKKGSSDLLAEASQRYTSAADAAEAAQATVAAGPEAAKAADALMKDKKFSEYLRRVVTEQVEKDLLKSIRRGGGSGRRLSVSM